MDWDLLLLDLVVTIFFYLLVPVILCIRHKPMSEKQINKTVIINGIVVWVVFSIIILSAGGETSSMPAAFFWSWIGKMIMKRVLGEDEENESTSDSTDDINDVRDKITISNQPPKTRYYCSMCGGLIDENTRKCTECGKQHPKKLSKKVILSIVFSVLLVFVVVVFALVGLSTDDSNGLIEYESYYVGVRTITVDNEATAEAILSIWKNNGATEEAMVALMDEYGASQGGSQLYFVEQGDLIDEIDDWCFDRSRKIGDVVIIGNDYGYTICYFSSVVER